jgi:hypothetical protein
MTDGPKTKELKTRLQLGTIRQRIREAGLFPGDDNYQRQLANNYLRWSGGNIQKALQFVDDQLQPGVLPFIPVGQTPCFYAAITEAHRDRKE